MFHEGNQRHHPDGPEQLVKGKLHTRRAFWEEEVVWMLE